MYESNLRVGMHPHIHPRLGEYPRIINHCSLWRGPGTNGGGGVIDDGIY